MTTKITTDNIASETLTTILGPKVSSIVYPGDDTAANTAGGDSITLLGSGFNNGASVVVNGTSSGAVTVVSSTQITFTAPAQTAGTYVIYVINSDGGTAISIPGISYSGTPTWSTSAGNIGVGYETGSISTTVTASGDAPITYSVVSGTLPTGSSLNTSSGLISGTASATASSTTYSFTIKATDAQNQDTNRAFSITVNPDVVTWSSPADSTTYEVFTNTAIANVAMSATSASGQNITYTADTLPTGLSITGANIAGTPTVAASTTTTLTATASVTNRLATRTINWVVSIANDTYFKNTTLLLNGETTVTPFISDASTNSFGLTINGDTKPVLFNPYQGDGYYSNYFDGTGDTLSIPSPTTGLSFGTGEFTIEMWVYKTSALNTALVDARSSASASPWACSIDASNFPYFYDGTSYTSSVAVTLNTWTHIAVVKTSGVLKIFVNGVQGYSASYGTNLDRTAGLVIGDTVHAAAPYLGYISNLRIVKGTAVYTTAFTPPTSPLTAIANTSLLTCQSNRFVDKSTNNFTITKNGDVSVSPAIPFTASSSYSTYGSTYFDGTGDYLVSSTSPTLPTINSSTPFTIEVWAYFNNFAQTTQNPNIFSFPGTTPVQLFSSTNGVIGLYDGTSTLVTGSVVQNAWYHIAVARDGSGNVSMWINGVRTSTTTGFTASVGSGSGSFYIATFQGSGGYISGYLSDLRVVNGTAVYTPSQATITVPTNPLTAIANTSLLTLQYNGGANNKGIIDNSNFNNIVTRFGNTSQGSFSPYSVTGWSNYFNGSSDYLSIADNTAFNFGTGDATVEFWFNSPGTSNNYPGIISSVNYNTAGSASIRFDNTGYKNKVFMYINGGGDPVIASTSSIAYNTWAHIAIVRQGTSLKLYLNGALDTSVTIGAGLGWYLSASGMRIGRGFDVDSGGAYFPGYISNIRLVKGTAVYTTTFTPSTTPLTTITNTSLLTCQSNRLIDNSPNSFTLTRNGDTSVQALDPFGSVPEAVPISYSNYFDGTTDFITAVGSGAVVRSSGSFTIEGWYYPTSSAASFRAVYSSGTGYATAGRLYQNNTTLTFYWSGSGGITGSIGWTLNTWQHFAVTWNGTTTKVYVNGQESISSTSPTYSGTVDLSIGESTYSPFGYISNFRIVNSVVYTTTTFTPSTTPLTAIANTSLLTCQSTTMIDNSTNRFTITANGNTVPRIFNPFGYTTQSATSYTPSLHGGSAYFDGTGDNLSVTTNPSLNVGAGNFTLEWWMYPTSLSGANQSLFFTGTSNLVVLMVSGTGVIQPGNYQNSGIVTPATGVRQNEWTHVAITRSSNAWNVYYNGVLAGTNSNYSFTPNTSSFTIGTGASPYFGYLSNYKLTPGTVLYTSNFVPPTQAVTNYSTNTPATLLLNFNNGGIIDQHGSNVLETVGNAQLSTSVKKYNNSSMYFDGTGDYLYSPPNINYAMGSGDFTIEFWYYPVTHTNTDPTIMGNYNVTWTSNKWAFHAPHASYASKYSFWVNNYASGSAILVSTSNVTNGAWAHIAITRSGSTWRIFVNGTIEATTTSSVALDGGTAASMDGFYIGANFYSGHGGRHINAYIDDLRFTKGYARYTSNFTAPTSALITK